MANLIVPPRWRIPENQVTPEEAYWGRRRFLRAMGIAGAGALALGAGCRTRTPESAAPRTSGTPPGPVAIPEDVAALYPARRNEAFVADRPLTPADVAASYNNFYEFSTDKSAPARLVERFRIRPWTVEVGGLVERPMTIDVDDLVRRMPLEERIYRFRCVEAWAMTVPWTGFPMRRLMDLVQPLGSARHVRLISFHRPEEAPGVNAQPWYPWPYHEGLRLDEAASDLTLLATGIYGRPLPKQHGAPIRLVTPWKYGYKSIKSVVRIEFVEQQPPTFWNTAVPDEYGYLSNVDPSVPHPRWSQASERLLPDMRVVPTLPYNGYGEHVAHLYA